MIVRELESSNYRPRTAHNASAAQATIAIAEDYNSRGEQLTRTLAGSKYFALPIRQEAIKAARKLYKHCRDNDIRSLNIAGNGIYTFVKHGWTQESLNQWMYDVLSLVHTHHPLDKIVSGGQTGMDLAGGVAAEALGIPCIMTFPKGFIQRTETVYELIQTEEDVLASVYHYVGLINK